MLIGDTQAKWCVGEFWLLIGDTRSKRLNKCFHESFQIALVVSEGELMLDKCYLCDLWWKLSRLIENKSVRTYFDVVKWWMSGERVNRWVSDSIGVWMSKWWGDWMIEYVNVKEWMFEWMSERVNDRISEWGEWNNEWIWCECGETCKMWSVLGCGIVSEWGLKDLESCVGPMISISM